MAQLNDTTINGVLKVNGCRIGYPDYSNIIEQYDDTGFTASADGWLHILAYAGWNATEITINESSVFIAQMVNSSSYPIRESMILPVKKGDVIACKAISSGITVPTSYVVRLSLFGIR